MHASMDVKVQRPMFTIRGPQNAEGIPISLEKWGWGGPHITRDMGTGVPISRGSPYRAYTGLRLLRLTVTQILYSILIQDISTAQIFANMF